MIDMLKALPKDNDKEDTSYDLVSYSPQYQLTKLLITYVNKYMNIKC